MNFKKILLFLSLLFTSLISFSQQIGSGFAPDAIPSFNTELLSGFYQGSNATGAIDGGGWNHLLNLRHSTPGNNHQLQIASSYAENDRLFFRKFARALGSSNPTWHEIATRDGNTFNGNQVINGEIFVSRSSAEGGALSLVNESKATQNAARQWTIFNMTGGYSNSLQFWSYGNNGYQGGPKFTILDGGNVGIGTASPQSKLQVSGSITLPLPGTSEIAEEGISFAPNHRFNYDGKFINHYGFGFYPYSKSSDVGGVNAYMSGFYGLDFFTQDVNRIRIAQGGNVGIGSINPDQKLTVKGKIHAEEIIVDLSVPADYVFQKYYTGKSELKSDYVMPTLAEIESFTKENNHLPNVPSAKEIQEKGMSLGEMSNVLLQKVEELTLYAIEQQKKLDEQNKTIEMQSKILADLTARLSGLEKK